MSKPNVAIIADKADAEVLDREAGSQNWNLFWRIINFDELYSRMSEIVSFVNKNKIDFVLYSRNDQVASRIRIGPITSKLKIGYSSFSGIDERNRVMQMKACFEDFLDCHRSVASSDIKVGNTAIEREGPDSGTFSLIFDTEQIGGVRYGLPRVLDLLAENGVRATFFLTNLMRSVYSNVVDLIARGGHEVGLHGKWHEFLSGLPVNEQATKIQEMKNDLGCRVNGANFLGRMDEATISALVSCEIEYFISSAINCYKPFNYPGSSNIPFVFSRNEGIIQALPILVETYDMPWFSIKNMIDSALAEAKRSAFPHVSVLLHPFRDGNLRHLHITQKLIKYLVIERNLRSVTLKELNDSLERASAPVRPHMNFAHINRKASNARASERLPKTRYDYWGLFENFILVYRLIRKHHGVF